MQRYERVLLRDETGRRESVWRALRMVGVTSTSQRSKSSGVGGGGVDVFFWKEMARSLRWVVVQILYCG
jgi:hypothetical protein